ncbi:Protein VPRBP [Hypsibius exemplaris]|uniref:Protein VPRBP n=1 Tax=Hypsibius exemplaris TaxID=2072580 RepID=A0A1W0X4A1_HYPEX|nr:Protein VPRBP [Hypsibius exemplaris]
MEDHNGENFNDIVGESDSSDSEETDSEHEYNPDDGAAAAADEDDDELAVNPIGAIVGPGDNENVRRAVRQSRRFHSLGETYRKDAETLLEAFRVGVLARQKSAETTETFKKLALLLQEAFEENLGLHQDPAVEILTSRVADSPKIHFLLEKLKKVVEVAAEENDDLIKRLCTTYLCESENDPDLQYYTAVILYCVVQGFSAGSQNDAEYMQVFFKNDDVFMPFLHFIAVDPAPSPTIRVPTRNAQEIRSLLCGLYGTCFERVVIDEFRGKLATVKNVVAGIFAKLRAFLSAFHPVVASPETHDEPAPSTSSPSGFRAPPVVAQPRSSMKRRLERNKSQLESSSETVTPKRKKQKSMHAVSTQPPPQLTFDETSSCSSWAEYERLQMGEVAQNFRVLPMDQNLEVRLMLDFLVGLATLEEFVQQFYELDALSLCYEFLDLRKRLNVRILGQVVHFLANLLFSVRFVNKFLESPYRLTQLIKIPYPSIPSVFVVKVLKNIVMSSEYALETIVKYSDLVQGATSFMVEGGLKSGYESPRKWASRFFTESLQYRIFMEAFDDATVDGLRTLLNTLGLYEYFWEDKRELERNLYTNEQLLSASEALTNVFQALTCYFTTDMVIKAEWFRQDLVKRARESGKEPVSEARFPRIPLTKAVRLEKEELENLREYMLTSVPLCRATRDRVARFCDMEGVQRLFQIMEVETDSWITFRELSVHPFHKMSLEVLEKCVLSRKGQDAILKYKTSDKSYPFTGIGLVLKLAVKSEVADVQKLALHVVANSVYGLRTGRTQEEVELPNLHKKGSLRPFSNDPRHFEFVVNALRQQRGINSMLRVLNDAEDADLEALRALACKVLTGMARSAPCKQILRELSFFRTGELQVLMRERSLDLHGDYVKFEKYSTELLEIVFDTKLKLPIPVNLADHVVKQDILRRTRINFASQEIDLLLLAHLESRDLTNTASCLVDEVGLKRQAQTPSSPQQNGRKTRLSISPGIMKSPPSSTSSTSKHHGGFKVPHPRSVVAPPLTTAAVSPKNFILDATDAPATVNGLPNLVGIVANNFRSQHAECEHPIALCPPFSLKKSHRCPAPSRIGKPPADIFLRLDARQGRPDNSATGWGRRLDRSHIFSRFKPIGNIEFPASDPEAFDPNDGMLSAAFLGPLQKDVVMGGRDGCIVVYNQASLVKPTHHRPCHEYCETYHLAALPRRTDLFLSCCTESSSLWRFPEDRRCALIRHYENTHYMDMPHWHNNIALGVQIEEAFIIDLETGDRTVTFHDELLQGRYARNRPSFHPADDIVTHDGLLFDVKTGRLIHKFDQFERHTSNGSFHPSGNEIIIDSEVWDLRNFKLLKSVSAFHQCQLKFNASGDVVYAIHYPEDVDEIEQMTTDFPGSFTTVDSFNYNTIFGMDLKRRFNAMALDSIDNLICLAEPYNETFCTYGRLLQIGVEKSELEVEEEEEDDEEDYSSDDDDDDDVTGFFDEDEYDDNEEEVMDDWWDPNDGDEVAELDGAEEEGSASDDWTEDENAGDDDGDDDEGDSDNFYELGDINN